MTANSGGGYFSEVRYKAWGETRFTSGNTPTTYRFTGQREEQSLGLYFYNARWYDPALGRFIQADTIVPRPGNSQAWDRYSYVSNNPLKYIDPSGHGYCDGGYGLAEDCELIDIDNGNNDDNIIWIKNWNKSSLESFAQDQGKHTSGCAPFSIAMALSLLKGFNVDGENLETYLLVTLHKTPGIGMIPENQEAALNDIFNFFGEPYVAEAETGGTPADLIVNLAKGDIVIVSVSWGETTNIKTYQKGIGHAMVVVGYDAEMSELYFLDPGVGDLINQRQFIERYKDDFFTTWLFQPNIFIKAGSMVTISTKP